MVDPDDDHRGTAGGKDIKSAYVGIPNPADDRLRGITGMSPIAGAGAPTAARSSVNTTPNRITPDLRGKLAEHPNPAISRGVNAVVSRKPGGR
jgi:hypothetical protein